jgi:hypothetical protein
MGEASTVPAYNVTVEAVEHLLMEVQGIALQQ